MKRFIILIVFVSMCLSVKQGVGQSYLPYYNLINKARLASFEKKYSKADKLYKRAFKIVSSPHAFDCRYAARNAAKMGKINLSISYYQQAANLGFELDELLLKEDSIFLGKRIAELIPHTYNSELCATIDSLCRQDQFYRKRDYDNNWKRQYHIDSTNILKVFEIRSKMGKIPGVKELGFSRANHFVKIFYHTPPHVLFNKLYLILISQAVDGDFTPNMVAGAIDKIAITDTNAPYLFTRTIFGTTVAFSKKDSVYYIHPVRNYRCLNKVRASIGLPTLEQYLLLCEDKTVYDEVLVRRNYPTLFMETPPRKPFIDCEGKWMEYNAD